MQVDAAFCIFDTQYFRVKTKWTTPPVGPSDVVLFREKIDVVSVKWLLISMSGFAPEAIKKAVSYRAGRNRVGDVAKRMPFVRRSHPT
jgi:hypothetical protein